MPDKKTDPISQPASRLFPSKTLLSAALGGLLWATAPACGPSTKAPVVTDAGQLPDGGNRPLPDGGYPTYVPPCTTNVPDGGGVVTSAQVVPNMTLDRFVQMCDQLGGKVQIHPECGGHNSCRGISYDTNTQTLSHHTCRGLNTCAGYSCVVC